MGPNSDRRVALVLAAVLALGLGGVTASLTMPGAADPSPTPGGVALASLGPSASRVAPAGSRAQGGSVAPSAKATVKPSTKPAAPSVKPGPTPTPTPAPKATPTPAPVAPRALTACPIFPASNVWNKRVDSLPVAADSGAMVAAIGLTRSLHPDFSAAGGYGIPYNIVGTATPRRAVTFQYASESDRVKYPIPAKPRIEGGSDRHLLMVDTSACKLYELFAAVLTGGQWHAGSGAVWDLRSNHLRPAGWTSADAAGLPIFPGLVRYEEVARGAINHAIRFTAPQTCSGYVYPARHQAGSGSCSVRPPMGLRVRLKASVNISGYGLQARIVLTALKRYGMILADNGSPWYITGAPNPKWNDDVLHALGGIKGSDFEVVDTSGLVNG
ncbi:MAG: hypothetical protein M3067_00710 [Chloroflexota bacterium]|nr:hypothetical protein [Chloroflexota bacterium]